VCVTPACGYVEVTGAFIIGLLGGPFCFFGAQVKHWLGYDDSLDAFGVHALGGIFGGIATGFFAAPIHGGYAGVYYAGLEVGGTQLGLQIYGIVVTIGWSAFMTALIALAVDKTIGLRVSAEAEEEGLDSSIHGETMPEASEHSASSMKRRSSQMNEEFAKVVEMYNDARLDSSDRGIQMSEIDTQQPFGGPAGSGGYQTVGTDDVEAAVTVDPVEKIETKL